MRKAIVWISIIVVLGLLGGMTFLYYGVYSEGVRAGTVIKLSKKGVLFKTWEGQLNIRSFGAVRSENNLSEVFEFSIKSDAEEVIHQLEEVSLSGERVNLHYVERYRALPWRGSTRYFVTKVVRTNKTEEEAERAVERAPFD